MLVLYFSIQTHCILLYKLRAFHSYKCGPLCSESTTGPGWFSTGRPTRDCGSAGSPVSCCPFPGLDRKNNSQWGHEDKCHTVLAHKLLKWTSDWFPGLTFRISQAFKKKNCFYDLGNPAPGESTKLAEQTFSSADILEKEKLFVWFGWCTKFKKLYNCALYHKTHVFTLKSCNFT